MTVLHRSPSPAEPSRNVAVAAFAEAAREAVSQDIRKILSWSARISSWPDLVIANSESGAAFHSAAVDAGLIERDGADQSKAASR